MYKLSFVYQGWKGNTNAYLPKETFIENCGEQESGEIQCSGIVYPHVNHLTKQRK